MMNITGLWKFTASQGLLVKLRETEVHIKKINLFSVLEFSTFNRIRLSMYNNLPIFIFIFCNQSVINPVGLLHFEM